MPVDQVHTGGLGQVLEPCSKCILWGSDKHLEQPKYHLSHINDGKSDLCTRVSKRAGAHLAIPAHLSPFYNPPVSLGTMMATMSMSSDTLGAGDGNYGQKSLPGRGIGSSLLKGPAKNGRQQRHSQEDSHPLSSPISGGSRILKNTSVLRSVLLR